MPNSPVLPEPRLGLALRQAALQIGARRGGDFPDMLSVCTPSIRVVHRKGAHSPVMVSQR
jgi:hypothetical protein